MLRIAKGMLIFYNRGLLYYYFLENANKKSAKKQEKKLFYYKKTTTFFVWVAYAFSLCLRYKSAHFLS